MHFFPILKRGMLWVSFVCVTVNGYAGGSDAFFMRPPSSEWDVPYAGAFFDDDDDRRVFVETQRVFRSIANRVVCGECDTVAQQGNALGLLLQMVVNNWTYHSLNEAAEAAFTRIFEEGNPLAGALHHLIDSIEEEYGNGASCADMVMRWILASLCKQGTSIPYPNVHLRAYRLLVNTHLVPRDFVFVYDAEASVEDGREMFYRAVLADLIEIIKTHFLELTHGDWVANDERLRVLDTIFHLATGDLGVEDDVALLETVTTGYDRLFQQVVFPEEVLLAFVQGLEAADEASEASGNLVHCILMLLCEKNTHNPYIAVRRRAYALLQAKNAVPPAFVTADLGADVDTAD